MHGQQDGGDARLLADFGGPFDAIHDGHREIHHYYLRPDAPGYLYGLRAVFGFPDDREAVLLQEDLEAIPQHCVIIRKNDSYTHPVNPLSNAPTPYLILK